MLEKPRALKQYKTGPLDDSSCWGDVVTVLVVYSADGFLLGSRDSSRYASAPVPVKLQVNAEKLLPPAPVKETLSSGILGFLVVLFF